MTKAEKAVGHILDRIRSDGRLAYLIGPLTEGYELLTDAYAETHNIDPDAFRRKFEKLLKPEPWPANNKLDNG